MAVMDLPVEVIAALCSVGGVVLAKGAEIGWRRWRHRGDELSAVITKGIKDGGHLRDQIHAWLREERERSERCMAEQEKLRVELDSIRRALTEEQRKTAKLERMLAERDKQIEELRRTLLYDYVRQPSIPAPEPEGSDERDTKRFGRKAAKEGTG